MNHNKLSNCEKVEVLTKLLRHYDYVYYMEYDNDIADIVYDMLKNDLEKLENNNPTLLKSDSPTQVINGGF